MPNTPVAQGDPVELAVTGVTKSFGPKVVLRDVDLVVAPGTVVALLGPSGCGKTTLLRTVAGLEAPDAGQVRVGGQLLTDGRTVTPPERRRIGMVFQDWALFPHLSVAANIGYGLPRGQRKGPRVHEALELVGLSGVADRLPGTLSGGQQQRVALARALAPRPSLILFDEPFSNLDTSLRVRVRGEVHRLVGELGITSLFVTHDQEEAFVVGDEVAVMHEGRIVQQAAPAELYDTPADAWVAGFVGDANLLAGTGDGQWATTALGAVALRPGSPAGAVEVLVRPEHLRVDPGGDAVVDHVEAYGHDAMLFVTLHDGPAVRVRVPGTTELRRHDAVTVHAAARPAVAYAARRPTARPTAAVEPGPVITQPTAAR